MSVEFDVSPVLRALNATFANNAPLLEEFGEIIVASISQNFDVGGRFGNDNIFGGGSQRWVPSKRAIEQSGLTLVDTARLVSSVTYQVVGNRVLFGTNVVYGAIHNFGGQAGRGKSVTIIPRPWAVIQNADIQEMIEASIAYYARLLTA